MFHFYILSVYIAPVIYLYFRIRSFFVKKRSKEYFGIFYAVLIGIFPLTEYLSHVEGIPEMGRIFRLGYYTLPYLLYLFLTVIAVDLFWLLGRLAGSFYGNFLKGELFRKIRVAVVFILPLLVVAGGIVNHNIIRVKHYRIEVPRGSSKIDRLKIVFAADFHLKGNVDRSVVDKFVETVKLLNPDIVLLGGDIIEGDRSDIDMEYFAGRFREIKPRYGIYTVLGNHEYHGSKDKMDVFNRLNIKVLRDDLIKIDDGFSLIGRKDGREEGRKEIGDLLRGASTDLPIIVLDHRPTDIANVSLSRVAIQLSGHTHNGQLFPVNFITKSLYRLSSGHEKIGNTHFFVTSGVQTWGPAVRTVGRSEIMVIDVEFD